MPSELKIAVYKTVSRPVILYGKNRDEDVDIDDGDKED